jgi:hypothetical protein
VPDSLRIKFGKKEENFGRKRVSRDVGVFCTDKIHSGQDRAFQFRGSLANYEAHGDLSWFRRFLGGNSPTSSGLI